MVRNCRLLISVSLIGIVSTASILAFGLLGAYHDQENKFTRAADDLLSQFENVVKEYATAGLWIHEACRTRTKSQEDFRTLYDYLVSSGLEFQAVSFAMNVSHAERPFIEEDTRNFLEGGSYDVDYEGFVGLEMDPSTGSPKLGPRSDQPLYHTVHYVEPFEDAKNRAALDFDLRTSALRWTAVEQAIATQQPAVTERLKLLQETQTGTDRNAYSVILMHPGLPGAGSQDVAVIAIRFPELLTRATVAFSNAKDNHLFLYVFDTTDSQESALFLGGSMTHANWQDDDHDHVSGDFLPEVALEHVVETSGRYIAKRHLSIGARTWTFVVKADNQEFRPTLFYVVFGSSAIALLTICLVCWMKHSSLRHAKLEDFRARADSEKAALIITSAKKSAIAERELNDFIAHEVRNPLSAAISASCFVSSQVRQEEPVTDKLAWQEMREDMNVIGYSLQFINDLLRDMLDMHRASSDQLRIETSHVDVLKDILEPVSLMLYRRGATFEVIVDCPENLVIESDRLRLKQVTLNLARNGVKFVTHGFVRLKACVVDGSVRIMIEDSGPGIPKGKHETLFTKFQDSLDVLNQGTGIGLSLSKKLVDLMEGDLWLSADYDSGIQNNPGARFVVDLKRPPVPIDELALHGHVAPTVAETSSCTQGGAASLEDHDPGLVLPLKLSVLLIDDTLVLRKLYTRSIKRICPTWTIAEAANGETALHMTDAQTYDLIFVDQYMASVDKQLLGTETVREMRSRGVTSVICGLSANDLGVPFKESGSDGFLIKPFPTGESNLRQELSELLSSRPKLDP